MLILDDLSPTSCLYIAPCNPIPARRSILDTVYQKSIRPAIETAEIKIRKAEKLSSPAKVPGTLSVEITGVDFVIAEISERDPEVLFYLGFAQSISKIVVTLRHHGSPELPSITRLSDFHLDYDTTEIGLIDLHKDLKEVLRAITNSTRLGSITTDSNEGLSSLWEMIDQFDYLNMVHELLLRENFMEIIKRDPGRSINFIALKPETEETRELSVFSIGTIPSDNIGIRGWLVEFRNEVAPTVKTLAQEKNLLKLENKIVLTLWFVWAPHRPSLTDDEILTDLARRVETSAQDFDLAPRHGVWTREYIENVAARYPAVTQKYLARRNKELRLVDTLDDVEELYRGTAQLGQQAADTTRKLIEKYEKEPRDFWQNIAFSATHKIGNTIFPIENNVDFLIRRKGNILKEIGNDYLDILYEIKEQVEMAKRRIAEFKRIAGRSAPEIRPVDITRSIDRIKHCAETAGFSASLFRAEYLPRVYADPGRLDEIFDELLGNSIKWLESDPRKVISIEIKIAKLNDLPNHLQEEAKQTKLLREVAEKEKEGFRFYESLREEAEKEIDRFHEKFLRVRFFDNGPGIHSEKKEDIFNIFYSQSPQGMGFGLAIVKKNMQDFGGDVLESGVSDTGAQFDLFFRCAERLNRWTEY
ncbi:MAG: sensor histidine kinase [bacterium]|nr:sensor histidine kinase [bacterium]